MINTGRKKLTAREIAEGFSKRHSEHVTREIVERTEGLPPEVLDALATLTSKTLDLVTQVNRLQSEVDRIKAVMSQVGEEALKKVRA